MKQNPQYEIPDEERYRARARRRFPVLAAVLLALAALGLAVFLLFNHFYGKLDVDRGGKLGSGGADRDVTNILLIGVDNDYAPGMDDLGNADGLIIVSINKNTRQIVLSSLMRDIKVTVPDGYATKITLAYHEGGTGVLIDTIESNFGVPIDSYVLVNYLNVIDLVEAVGGITLELTESELYWMQPKIRNLNVLLGQDEEANLIDPAEAGTLTLNGIQTAAYLRIRYAGNNDFERTERARRVLLQIAARATEMGAGAIGGLAEELLPQIKTDLSRGELLSLLLGAPGYMKYETVSLRIPIDGSWYDSNDGNAMLVLDMEANRDYLHRAIYEGRAGES